MIKKSLVSVLIAGLVAAAGLTAAYAKDKITLEGSTTVLPIAQLTAEEFMNVNTNADISVRGGGSGVGIASLIDGACDIADSSRAMKDKELQTAVARGVDPKANVIAMDGITLVVNKANPINGFTTKQIKDIYTGKLSDWSQLGAEKMKIVVVSRDSASGTFEAFGTLALGGAKVRGDALMQASNQAVASVVAKTPGAIGYVGIGYVTAEIKAIPVNDITASKETVLSGKYPFSRPLFMYTNGAPKGTSKEYIDFVLSPEGQKLVEQAGYIGLK
jgi:phosphate transport system substrate-binding protein